MPPTGVATAEGSAALLPTQNEITSSGGIAVQEFSFKTFNEVADYHMVRHIGEKEKELGSYAPKINEIGQVFLDHGMEKYVGLSLTHRHFSLKEGELKVAVQRGNEVKIVARKASDKDRDTLVPYMFQVVEMEDGRPGLIPLEYVDHSDNAELFNKCKTEYQAIQNEAFLKDFLKVLAEQEVGSYFGLILNSRDDIVIKEGETKLESGGGKFGERTLLVRAFPRSQIEEDKEVVTQVSWRFTRGKDGNIVPVGECMSREHEGCTGHNCGYQHGHCGYQHGHCRH